MSAVRPRIAMVADRRDASFGAWRDVTLAAVWNHYVEAIDAAGGMPIVIPVVEAVAEEPDLALVGMSGLLLTGGRDIDATSYGEEPHPSNEDGDALRDRVELVLARAALERDLPVLGVCRGMQILNIARGGRIDQHRPDEERVHRADPGTFVDHGVSTVAGTRLAGILGDAPADVRSHHHQGIAELGEGLIASAHSPDGLIEGLEADDRAFCVAVLWHPEENLEAGGAKLYEALVEAAR